MMHHLLFSVDRVPCALPLADIRIVIQMVQLGRAPESRPGLAGTVNLHGQIIPVWSVRSFFGIPDRLPQLTDKLIVTEIGQGSIALWVDETHVVQQNPVPPASAENVEITGHPAPGVDLTADGTFLFSDLHRFLEPGNFVVLNPRQDGYSPHRGQVQ